MSDEHRPGTQGVAYADDAGAGTSWPPRVVVDPRLRQRRIDVARSVGRRRLRRLGVLGLLVAVAALVWVVLHSPLLDVDRVEVAGAERTAVASVVDAAGVTAGTPLVEVDAARVRARVARLPWVSGATVDRGWDGVVRVAVVERVPVAVLAAGEGSALVDAAGVVTAVVASRPVGLPLVATGGAAPPPGAEVPVRARRALRVVAALPDRWRGGVDTVADAGREGIELRLTGGGAILLTGSGDLALELVAAVTVVDAEGVPDGAVLDVRVPRAPVIRPPAPPDPDAPVDVESEAEVEVEVEAGTGPATGVGT